MADSFSLDPKPIHLADVAGFRTGAAASGVRESGPDVGVLLCETTAKLGWADFLGTLKGGTSATAEIKGGGDGAGEAQRPTRTPERSPRRRGERHG